MYKRQRVERHWNTNEVFILTAGEADLILFDDADGTPTQSFVIAMQHSVAYNVRQSIWHHVIMSPDAHVILIEREETGPATTDYYAPVSYTHLDVYKRQSGYRIPPVTH